MRLGFKRCSPCAIVQELAGLETLIMVNQAGGWRDGNEVLDGTTDFPRPWLFGDESEDEDEDDDEDERGIPEDEDDFWLVQDADSRAYKPNSRDEDERRYSPSGHCGLALVDYSKIPIGEGEDAWGIDCISAREAVQSIKQDFRAMRSDHPQMYEEDEDEDSERFINWDRWVPPKVELALFQKTAKSCYLQDWDGLEKDWIDDEEVAWANWSPHQYAKLKYVRESYPPGLLLRPETPNRKTPEVRVPLEGEEFDDEDEEDRLSDDSESMSDMPDLIAIGQ